MPPPSSAPAAKKRKLAFGLLAAAALAAAALAIFGRSNRVVLTGVVTTDDVIVSSDIAGRLEALRVREGDAVKRGELLARIAPGEWRADLSYYQNAERQAAAQVAEAEADLRFQRSQTENQVVEAEANLAAARAQVAQAVADQENARLTFGRQARLYAQGTVSVQDYDQARTAQAGADARVEALRKQAAAAEAAVLLAKSSQEQDAARKAAVDAGLRQLAAAKARAEKAAVYLGYTRIEAPIDGIVDVRAARQGEVVAPGQAIVTLVDPDDLWVRADLEESYIDRVHVGDRMTVRLPSGAEREGTVFFRGVDADYATQRDVSRTKRDIKTFEIRLRCDNRDRALALGMTAYVVLRLR